MSTLQLAILCGGLVGLGITLVAARLMPAHPDLKSAFERLDPSSSVESLNTLPVSGIQDRVGVWVQRRAPAGVWARVPIKELALLQRPVHQHFGEKALLGIVGLVALPLVAILGRLMGLGIPLAVPLAGSLLLAIALFMTPDITVRAEAARARKEFVRALASYIDLVALERASGTGSTQSLKQAADVGDSWVFQRIGQEIARSGWSGQSPWDGLKDLADQLELPELADLAEIMRLSREEGASVAGQLRARSTSMRSALLSEDLAKANAAGEKMTVPVAALALIFLAILATPAVLRIAFAGA